MSNQKVASRKERLNFESLIQSDRAKGSYAKGNNVNNTYDRNSNINYIRTPMTNLNNSFQNNLNVNKGSGYQMESKGDLYRDNLNGDLMSNSKTTTPYQSQIYQVQTRVKSNVNNQRSINKGGASKRDMMWETKRQKKLNPQSYINNKNHDTIKFTNNVSPTPMINNNCNSNKNTGSVTPTPNEYNKPMSKTITPSTYSNKNKPSVTMSINNNPYYGNSHQIKPTQTPYGSGNINQNYHISNSQTPYNMNNQNNKHQMTKTPISNSNGYQNNLPLNTNSRTPNNYVPTPNSYNPVPTPGSNLYTRNPILNYQNDMNSLGYQQNQVRSPFINPNPYDHSNYPNYSTNNQNNYKSQTPTSNYSNYQNKGNNNNGQNYNYYDNGVRNMDQINNGNRTPYNYYNDNLNSNNSNYHPSKPPSSSSNNRPFDNLSFKNTTPQINDYPNRAPNMVNTPYDSRINSAYIGRENKKFVYQK